jgi:hypothetical protein
MLDVMRPPVLSGGTRRMRPERRIFSIASLAAASRSLGDCTRLAASSGTAGPMALTVESRSAVDSGSPDANGLRGRGTEYHGAAGARGTASRDGPAPGVNGRVGATGSAVGSGAAGDSRRARPSPRGATLPVSGAGDVCAATARCAKRTASGSGGDDGWRGARKTRASDVADAAGGRSAVPNGWRRARDTAHHDAKVSPAATTTDHGASFQAGGACGPPDPIEIMGVRPHLAREGCLEARQRPAVAVCRRRSSMVDARITSFGQVWT